MLKFHAQQQIIKEMIDRIFPPLTLDIVKSSVDCNFYSSTEVKDILDIQRYKFYGCLNAGLIYS